MTYFNIKSTGNSFTNIEHAIIKHPDCKNGIDNNTSFLIETEDGDDYFDFDCLLNNTNTYTYVSDL